MDTDSQYITNTNRQFSLHTYQQETKLAYTAPLSSWSYGLREDLSFSFVSKSKCPERVSDHLFTYRKHETLLHIKSISCG